MDPEELARWQGEINARLRHCEQFDAKVDEHLKSIYDRLRFLELRIVGIIVVLEGGIQGVRFLIG